MIVVSTPSFYFILTEVTIDDKALTISINQHNNRIFKKGFIFSSDILQSLCDRIIRTNNVRNGKGYKSNVLQFYNIAVYILR